MKLFFLLSLPVLMPAANSYYTTFPATENPISQGGLWTNGSSASASWGDVRTTTNLSFGVSLPTTFGDPTAVLTGSWGATQTASGVIKVNTTPSGCCSEIELRLRTTISSNSIAGYEMLCPLHTGTGYGYQIVRWNGANGQYVVIGGGGSAHQCVDGDVLKGTASGTSPVTLNFYNNGSLVVTACDNGQASGGSCGGFTYNGPGGAAGPFTTGTPGIGFFDSADTNWNFFGFSSYWATDGVPVMTTTTASSITSSGASSGGTVIDNGGASVSSEGTCYATSANPTTPCTSDGTSTPFTSTISGLSAGTLYHYRSFGTNANGTGYGLDLTFTTSGTPAFVYPFTGAKLSGVKVQ